MPYYKECNVLFIHIPKTGGSVIENEIKKKYKDTLFSSDIIYELNKPLNSLFILFDESLKNILYSHIISPQHYFYLNIYKYRDILNVNFNNIKIFSVVRNPYDRIISDLLWLKLIDNNTNSQQVYNIITKHYLYRHDLDNHNQPQYKFVTDENLNLIPNIKIFHSELLNNTNDELNKFLGFEINIKQKNINKNYSKFLNKQSIMLINNIYKKDFEIFGYKQINPDFYVQVFQNLDKYKCNNINNTVTYLRL